MRFDLLTGVAAPVWQQSSVTWVLVAITCGLLAVAFVAWRRRAVPAAPWLAALCVAAAAWTLTDGLSAAAVPLTLKLDLAKIGCLGVLALGPCWLLMARAAARRPPLRWPWMLVLWAIPACAGRRRAQLAGTRLDARERRGHVAAASRVTIPSGRSCGP